jgi:DNA-binding FrmR family transcriptional regulator
MNNDEAGRLINRLRRVEGQSRGLQRMIEEGRPCEEIFTQLAATKAALDRVGVLLISLKMRECLAEEADGDLPASPEAVEKALEAFLKYARCVK